MDAVRRTWGQPPARRRRGTGAPTGQEHAHRWCACSWHIRRRGRLSASSASVSPSAFSQSERFVCIFCHLRLESAVHDPSRVGAGIAFFPAYIQPARTVPREALEGPVRDLHHARAGIPCPYGSFHTLVCVCFAFAPKTTPTAARPTADLPHRCTHAFAPPSIRRPTDASRRPSG